jgi:hypothetical protein
MADRAIVCIPPTGLVSVERHAGSSRKDLSSVPRSDAADTSGVRSTMSS